MIARRAAILLALAVLAACGTYYDPTDDYARGVRLYDRGDFVSAKQWWQPLADKGDCDAQFRMGLLAMDGRAVERDPAVVVDWWTKAADQGQPRAQLSLGDFTNPDNSYTRIFCKKDCAKDAAVAYHWYLLGQRFAGYDADKRYAALVLEKIRAQLSPEERQRGEALAAAWQATPRQCKSRVLL